MFSPAYLIVLGLSTVLGLISRTMINNAYKKYSKITVSSGITGCSTARSILRNYGINDVSVNQIGGTLSDHYHPSKGEVNLSRAIYAGHSIASVAVSAHECGHVLQHKKGFAPIQIRNSLLPVANFGNKLTWPLVILGMTTQISFLVTIGIILFSASVLFHLVTLPIEIDASRRAMDILKRSGALTSSELAGARSILKAAASTYLSAMLVSIINLIYLLSLRKN